MQYTASILALAAAVSAQGFTSIYNITATPNQVVNASSLPAPGQPGATGQFNYAINSNTNTICYDITLFNVDGTYQSPANTATHIHEAAVGRNGPPRIAFPNPVSQGSDAVRRSVGCLTGPFTTGLRMADNVTDTGAGFTVAQIEANPAGFFTDSHTNLFVPGVVRGQMNQSFRLLTNVSAITTATLTATQVITISRCATTVVSCPLTTAPITTTTVSVYTTICPISVLTTLPGFVATTAPVASVPVATSTVRASTASAPVASSAASVVTSVRASSTTAGAATTTTTRPVTQFTGAANVNAVGGGIVAAAVLVAGALL